MTRVLIVEDESIVALHLKRLIEDLNHTVIGVTSNMRDALDVAAEGSPDLALVDIRIQGAEDGVATAHALHEAHGCAIVFVTAFADHKTLARTETAGASGYLVKPFSEAQLRAVVATAIAGHRRMQAMQTKKQHFARALMAIADAIVIVDERRVVTFMNPPAEELMGISVTGARGREIGDVLNCRRDGEPIDPLHVPDGGEEQRVEIADGDGTTREVAITATKLTGSGEGDGYAIALHDVSGSALEQWDKTRSGLRQRLKSEGSFAGMIGSSQVMIDLYGQVEQLAAVDWTVLIEGETGVGKELVAKALHSLSPRRDGPIIAVNCAGLTDTLLGSQLFGHKRGAFTGAVADHPGVFESADGGTLFLDEIGDVSAALQRTLLRVLDDRKVVRIGDSKERHVDVRIVCASQHHLPTLVEKGTFRSDLMFRLRAARLSIAPLYQRGDDVLLLANRFLEDAAHSTGKALRGFDDSAREVLSCYRWPGNVRELRGAISQAALSAKGPVISRNDLPSEILESTMAVTALSPENERERIIVALQRSGGNRSEAARILQVSRATLYRRIADLNLKKPIE